jgi:hypothetical protein
MRFTVNTIIKWEVEDEKQSLERILFLDQDLLYVININDNSLPFPRKISDINEALFDERAQIVNEDPYLLLISDEELPPKHKEKRDKAWKIIKNFVRNEPEIFEPTYRRKLIKKTVEQFDVSENTVASYLKRYWKRGKTPNALVPDYRYCGGPGKERTAGKVKRGRPRKHQNITGEGINITEDIKKPSVLL